MTVLPSAEKVDAPDRDAIVRVVQLYVDGFNDCDVDKFIQAFHEDAWIFFTHRDGTLYKGLIADSFEEWATPPAQRIVGRVISVTQAGEIASVLLGFDNADDLFDGWVDLHTLLRIDGTWKIMNKTATHCSRAAWAAPKAQDEQDARSKPHSATCPTDEASCVRVRVRLRAYWGVKKFWAPGREPNLTNSKGNVMSLTGWGVRLVVAVAVV